MPKPTYPYQILFRKLVPDLQEPDRDGWAIGTCPYCQTPKSFRVNLFNGHWTCMPTQELANKTYKEEEGHA